MSKGFTNTLKIPMMMFGKFRYSRAKRDEDNKVIKKNGKNVMERYWKTHSESNGDPGVYPSVNHIYKRIGRGRQMLTDPAIHLSEEWAALARMWVADNDWDLDDEKVVLEIHTYFPLDNRNRDTHNVLKLMLDSFEDIIYTNDRNALPRMMDFNKVQSKEEYPYFELVIYKKEDEHEIKKRRYRGTGQAL